MITKTHLTIIIIVFVSLLTLTTLHDPLLHGAVAKWNGWEITNYEHGIMTGYTNITMTEEQFINTPPISVWTFFMLPPLLLFFGAFIIVIFEPHPIIATVALILMFLNLASLSPEILLPTSDSSQAMAYLISTGTSPLIAGIIHWGIFALAIIALATFIYIMFENNQKDSERRIRSIKL